MNWMERLQRARAVIPTFFAVIAIAIPLSVYASVQQLESVKQADIEERAFREKNELRGHSDIVLSVAFSPVSEASPEGVSQMIASASADNTVKLWDRNGTLLNTLVGQRFGLECGL